MAIDEAAADRIRALEAKVEALEAALSARSAEAPGPAEPEPSPFSRRRLLWSGGAIAAGAAGAVMATPTPASASTPATDVTVTPTGNISATNVQAALVEKLKPMWIDVKVSTPSATAPTTTQA